jgi:hypothetical protein
MLKLSRVVVIALIAVFVAAHSFTPNVPKIQAQDEGTKVICDSDLILQLYVAEYYLGYGQVHTNMMGMEGVDTTTMLDLEAFDKGQFTLLFDNMMGMMDSGMMDDMMMDEETMTTMTDMMMMSEEDMMGMMGDMMGDVDMSTMTTLAPAVIPGEDPQCTALRAELNRYYAVLAYSAMMMGTEGTDGDTGEGTGEATEEATAEATTEGQ